jgi:beta-1,4-mannosyl-glycoprotein beta-1,4-N-acetylglucosaminyltransferase
MIIDTFLFGWELDMLQCRLHEMNSFVDYFLLVESRQTFQGEAKPLVFADNRELFDDYRDKIIVVEAESLVTDDPWQREYLAREVIKRELYQFSPDDIIIHGDVDEIVPKAISNQLDALASENQTVVLNQTMYSMAVDWQYPNSWRGSVIAKKSVVDSMAMVDMRNARLSSHAVHGGWHFSWLGGPEMIRQKASAFSHTEDSVQSYIQEMGERLYTEGYHVLGEKLIPVEVDNTYPDYIKERKCPEFWHRPR